MKRILGVTASLILLFILGLKPFNVHFYPTGAIPGNVEYIQSYNIKNGKAILFEDKKNNSFGIAEVRKFGPIYFYNGGTNSYEIENDMPFSVAGYENTKGEFMVAIKVPTDSSIKYISLGNHLEEGDPLNETISLDTVQTYSTFYLIKEVKGNYVFFLTNGYSENSWTVRGFDKNSHLIADKLYGSQPRYLR